MARTARRFRLVAITALVAMSLGVFAGGAAAKGPDYVGSCNMLQAIDKGGLYHAWVVENANGWDGKWVAVDRSGCPFDQFDQPSH